MRDATPGPRIDPEGFYDETVLRAAGVSVAALRKARLSGKLPYRDVGGVIYYQGRALREWLEGRKGDARS